MVRRVSPVIIALAVASWLALGAGSASASPVSCGDTITTNRKLHHNLVNCRNQGIVIGADDITLDLNGHRIDGNRKPVRRCRADHDLCDLGVDNTAGHTGVTIKGGRVRQFVTGVYVLGARNNRLRHLVASKNVGYGIVVGESTRTQVSRNLMFENGTSGVVLFDSRKNRIARNSAVRNGHTSLFLIGSDRNRIKRNKLKHNGDGIELIESSGNRVRKNAIHHSQGAAIVIDLGHANRVRKNRINANGDGVGVSESRRNRISHNTITGTGFFGDPESGGFGIILDGADRNTIHRNSVVGGRGPAIFVTSLDSQDTSDRNVVSDNVVTSRLNDGILVNANAGATVLRRNRANRNGDDGIDADASGTRVSHNRANRNHDLGIEAVPGVIDGGGNTASGNGNPAQCTNVACS
jgi:parallel beta-helix repeat protein